MCRYSKLRLIKLFKVNIDIPGKTELFNCISIFVTVTSWLAGMGPKVQIKLLHKKFWFVQVTFMEFCMENVDCEKWPLSPFLLKFSGNFSQCKWSSVKKDMNLESPLDVFAIVGIFISMSSLGIGLTPNFLTWRSNKCLYVCNY